MSTALRTNMETLSSTFTTAVTALGQALAAGQQKAGSALDAKVDALQGRVDGLAQQEAQPPAPPTTSRGRVGGTRARGGNLQTHGIAAASIADEEICGCLIPGLAPGKKPPDDVPPPAATCYACEKYIIMGGKTKKVCGCDMGKATDARERGLL